ncbi:hypothetical protein EPUS_09467 [Endocarpon pusillum Z07020]|uniref:Uncharacterized protein n=1 Tax=Endocarpon pusillum (strain Z07020 / HMAS-L-300199) TaxID=1263415 RepID=U1I0S9_ENDPU|nr:uncharacterized protein EPUS_09467 [Endocarpon pusillum Z07020]ERF76830.1 hypothetical protein EPUS_09467 [Endocarpon pusillum Z07020]
MSTIEPTAQGRTGPTCPPQYSPYDSTRRTVVNDIEVYVFAWPSRGGVIILEHAEALDLEFLSLDPLDPPAKRFDSQRDEDALCRRLLLLGAKWWDSEARWRFIKAADELDDSAIAALEEEAEPAPTTRERRWVSVCWPTEGGLWVSEFDTNLWGIEEGHNVIPSDATRLRLSRTMDERCQVLKDRFNGKFYKDVSEYKGHAFINSWDWKDAGEVGPLVK